MRKTDASKKQANKQTKTAKQTNSKTKQQQPSQHTLVLVALVHTARKLELHVLLGGLDRLLEESGHALNLRLRQADLLEGRLVPLLRLLEVFAFLIVLEDGAIRKLLLAVLAPQATLLYSVRRLKYIFINYKLYKNQ
jgi:hypothetical protein